MGGKPWKADTPRKDDDKDAKGNRKEHHEEIIDKNGKCCTKYARDSEWDSKGNLIKKTESRTDVPCDKYILEWNRVGNLSVNGAITQWGPNIT
jgi:hypothetical protein